MQPNVTLLAALTVLAVVAGLWLRRRNGRWAAQRPDGALTEPDLGAPLGARATLLQFSSEVCAPCRAARRVLADVAGATPGVAHVEVDAAQRLDLVRRLDVRRTPTVLLLDADGRPVQRSTGAPTRDQVMAGLARSGVRS